MSERTLLLGYDLGDRKTQMAVYDPECKEPLPVGQTEDNLDGLLDTAIFLEGREPMYDFLSKLKCGEDILVDGVRSDPVHVLGYYFRKTLTMTRKKYPSQTIRQLVVTIPEQDPEFVGLIYAALGTLGIERDRAVVISHKQSYLYYVLYQQKEIWMNDVGMFDYDGEHLRYYQMQVDRRKNPILAGVIEKDYTDAMGTLAQEETHKGAAFENIVAGAIHKQILSALYMNGEGFEGEWADEVLRRLCVGRRLFKGQNLYVSGACYAAKEMQDSPKLSNFLLMDENMISSHLTIEAYTEAKPEEIRIAKAGTPWYQVDQSLDFIPDGDTELVLTAKNVFTKEEKKFILDLEPVSGKLDRHCRVGMRVRFSDVTTCIITLKDKGFGEIFPTSNRIWEKTITIDG